MLSLVHILNRVEFVSEIYRKCRSLLFKNIIQQES
jgi:hypothetical protein